MKKVEMPSGRSKKEYAKEAGAAAELPTTPAENGAAAESDLEAVVAT